MPTQNRILPAMEGRNGSLIIVQDRVPLSYPMKSFNFKPNVTKHADGVCGEERDRLSLTLNFYEGSFQMLVVDAEFLEHWLVAQGVRDAMTIPLEQAGALRFRPNNGTRKSFILDELILDEFDYNAPGRAEKKMCTINYRCSNLKQSKAA